MRSLTGSKPLVQSSSAEKTTGCVLWNFIISCLDSCNGFLQISCFCCGPLLVTKYSLHTILQFIILQGRSECVAGFNRCQLFTPCDLTYTAALIQVMPRPSRILLSQISIKGLAASCLDPSHNPQLSTCLVPTYLQSQLNVTSIRKSYLIT